MSKPVRRHRRPYRNGYVRQHSRGTRAERRFFEAIRRYRRLFPQWLFDIRQATPELDRAGVDAVIYTTEAIFYPNIKSDADGESVRYHMFKYPLIPYIVVHSEENYQQIFDRTVETAMALREEFFARQCSAQSPRRQSQ
ncbi:hypothetical protein A2852_01920 [Candidatus Adlerbacteria bacterium RIFCSPHIGHO2_01_FULL_54_23]|uniref:Uncharacterized protein n=3 Tax=Candidatus Adleribacteriota TaxID=1752736 RepID=A0A1F4XZB5_9BACT|nr:MAG: hypothetical protein UY83_C0005G0010 [Candidatus Adlerbacteria bacterium GW2011_GWA1_54_10]KKW36122.1 MAG: hypothetical protein UY84_C0001G0010 [Candidatus Adlerbacteria bacterium GW2011_GWA2_54_12]KKW37424.1 MAG: hypothetical protein UY86_C0009G0058 [Candidatus Adlerbacteria bacterium GW2011_GWB1_54_7]OGC79088.1 MAG: hypothetical protein A2852_01920 [Candidatus Adlerbacteria bacterium RIFCSPHIGHO2_01_FULL_54_23]OGC87019.1 MAG: hypothetical protein A3B33_03000 [Candidatus Adlerbacteria 